MLFDAANPDASTEKRTPSTVAPQALLFLNHPFVLAQARHLAARLRAGNCGDESAGIAELTGSCSRGCHARKRPRSAVSTWPGRGIRAAEKDWQGLAHILMCSNEFIYVD